MIVLAKSAARMLKGFFTLGDGCWLLKKKTAQREVFGPDVPRTSRGHSCRRPGPKTSERPSKPWKSKHFGANIHRQKRADVHDPRGVQKNFGQRTVGLMFCSLQGGAMKGGVYKRRRMHTNRRKSKQTQVHTGEKAKTFGKTRRE